ncbi:NADH:ubiquinone oxidoreductase subunit ASHI isoform X2 [Arctopsyche grandis]|uniref:NADH:ubiquinone oxidoreductase subunit ASHI isoform X2 n=1 Tax=Arctopsyche grandis TaxID=121162 RepID=UPI00406D691D
MIIDWNKDFKAGPYPTTPEERKAAAKKYNLPEEWYEVYPDDGLGYGDYPKLPLVSTEARSDYYPWDYPEFKRNFNEPVHIDEDIINDTRINVSHRYLVPIWEQILWLLGTVAGAFGLYFYFDDYDWKMYHVVLPKQMPHMGEVHYTFESPKSDKK